MKSFKYLNIFLIGLILPLIFWSVASFYLAKKPYFFIETKDFYYFYRLNLTSLFFSDKIIKISQKVTNTINNMSLKAIYKNGKNSFIIVNLRGKSRFLNLNDKIDGYKLKEIKKDEAIFEKNGNLYSLTFKKNKTKYKFVKTDNYTISKNTFNEYAHNLSKIWRNIGIIKYREGYKITYIKRGSIFDRIGLKKGDILLEVNGKKLSSDKDAWDLYKNMNKFNYYEIKLKRNNQIKVINYEID